MKTLEEERFGLRFALELSARYHQKRESVFKRLELCTSAAAALATAGGFLNYVSQGPAPVYLIVLGVVGFFQLIEQIVDLRSMQYSAKGLATRYTDLEIELMAAPLTRETIDRMTFKRLELQKDEGATLRVLAVICRNELMLAKGYPKNELKPIGPVQRFLAPFIDWRAHLFERYAAS